ncbi:MAG: hypothetical protein R3277_00525 [Brumimicrobium sp.]|nr:hypothetical protein [Brumimicrobium sp.]
MNRFYNIWIFVFTFLTFPFAVAVGLNMDFTLLGIRIPGEEFAYKDLFFGIVSGIILVLSLLRSSKKWMGIRIINQSDKFRFTSKISSERKSRVVLYNLIEALFSLLIGFTFLYMLPSSVIYLPLVYFLMGADFLINTLVGVSWDNYGIGLTKKAIVAVDRDAKVIYLKGLKCISKHQDTLYFEYKNGLILHFPTNLIPAQKEDAFIEVLKNIADPDKVYYSGFSQEF